MHGLPGVQRAAKALAATDETLITDALPGDTMVRVTSLRRFLPDILVALVRVRPSRSSASRELQGPVPFMLSLSPSDWPRTDERMA